MGKRVEYPNGFVGVASDKVAEVYAKRAGYKILGDAKPATPKQAPKKIDRDALIKQAVKDGLGTKEELAKLSDSELANMVGE